MSKDIYDLPESIDELSPDLLSAITNKIMSMFHDVEQDEAKEMSRTILQRKYKLSANELDLFLAETCLLGHKQGNEKVCGRATELISKDFKDRYGPRYQQMKDDYDQQVKNSKSSVTIEESIETEQSEVSIEEQEYQEEVEEQIEEEVEESTPEEVATETTTTPAAQPSKDEKKKEKKPSKAGSYIKSFLYVFIVCFIGFAIYQNLKPTKKAPTQTLDFLNNQPAPQAAPEVKPAQEEKQPVSQQQPNNETQKPIEEQTVNTQDNSSLVFFSDVNTTTVDAKVEENNMSNSVTNTPIVTPPLVAPQHLVATEPKQESKPVEVVEKPMPKTPPLINFDIKKLKSIENEINIINYDGKPCFSYEKSIYCDKDTFFNNEVLHVTKNYIRFFNNEEQFNYKLRIKND